MQFHCLYSHRCWGHSNQCHSLLHFQWQFDRIEYYSLYQKQTERISFNSMNSYISEGRLITKIACWRFWRRSTWIRIIVSLNESARRRWFLTDPFLDQWERSFQRHLRRQYFRCDYSRKTALLFSFQIGMLTSLCSRVRLVVFVCFFLINNHLSLSLRLTVNSVKYVNREKSCRAWLTSLVFFLDISD